MAGTVLTSNTYDSTAAGFLAANGVWEGAAQNVLAYTRIVVYLSSSHNSAAQGVQFQYSPDGSTWGYEETATYLASDAQVYALPVLAKYFRVRYTNGTSVQTSFALQCIGHVGSEASRPRGEVVVIQATATITSAGTTNVVKHIGGERSARGSAAFLWDASVAGGVSDTVDCLIDFSLDGVFWANAIHFTQIAGSALLQYTSSDPMTTGVTTYASQNVSADVAAPGMVQTIIGPYMRARFIASQTTALACVHSLKAYIF